VTVFLFKTSSNSLHSNFSSRRTTRLGFATSLTAEYAFAPPTALVFIAQLDEALAPATIAERESEAFVLQHVREIANGADPYRNTLSGHSCRVSRLARRLAEQMELQPIEIERIAAAALFHDLGKSRIDSRIWTKPSCLDPEEFEMVKMHPVLGAEMIRPFPALESIVPGIELHHEALDGSGYPYRLRDSDIPLTARVTTVADVFDAMTTTRTYQAAIAAEAALATLRHLAGVKFDVRAVAALCEVMEGCRADAEPALVYEQLIARIA